jgi:hypothetical protein
VPGGDLNHSKTACFQTQRLTDAVLHSILLNHDGVLELSHIREGLGSLGTMVRPNLSSGRDLEEASCGLQY